MKRIGSPKNGNIRAFFAKCRESPGRAFRKQTPISGGAKGDTEKVRSFVTFYTDGFPYLLILPLQSLLVLFRCCTGEVWQDVMMGCIKSPDVKCDPMRFQTLQQIL